MFNNKIPDADRHFFEKQTLDQGCLDEIQALMDELSALSSSVENFSQRNE
jgi:hypothetical protein